MEHPHRVEELLRKRRQVAERVCEAFDHHLIVSAVLVFGSVASGHVDQYSDVDMLIICQPEILSVVDRTSLLSSIGEGWRFQGTSNDNALFAASDTNGSVEDVLVTVHYQTASWISEVLNEVLDHGAITTEKLPFRAYTLPALLQRAWLLRDKNKLVQDWRERAKVFPRQLKLNLLQHFTPRLRENISELKASAERGLGPRAFLFHLNWAVDAMTGILYALNEIYDPADRRAERTILPTLPQVPKDFISRLTEILEGPFDEAGARYRAQFLEQLAAEILEMAESHYIYEERSMKNEKAHEPELTFD